MRTLARSLLLLTLVAGHPRAESTAEPRRFLISGDGTISLRSTKNRSRFSGRYRRRDGSYDPKALRRINRVFGGRYRDPAARISLRFIEALSALRAKVSTGGWITISSGYRSPAFNTRLRNKGRTVAKASLHQYGMAADLAISGVGAKKLWEATKALGIGGAGYYGGKWVHVDVGPVRAWTQGTANVRKGQSNENARIILHPGYDIYRPGERMKARFARMTAYPIFVARAFTLQRERNGAWIDVGKRALAHRTPTKKGCRRMASIAEMMGFAWKIPPKTPAGRYRLRVEFCAVKWPAMPKRLESRPIAIRP